MIGRLRGTIIEKKAPGLVLDVGGVGYEIDAPMTTFYELPPVGSNITLYTHFVVREDAQLLFGFVAEKDRALFRSLIKISGVGGKLALALLSGMSANDFVATVQSNDANRLTCIPGVGKKTAERLIIEMRDRIKDWQQDVTPGDGQAATPASDAAQLPLNGINDAVSALIALGFKPPEASRMVSKVHIDGLASEEIIRRALQSVAP